LRWEIELIFSIELRKKLRSLVEFLRMEGGCLENVSSPVLCSLSLLLFVISTGTGLIVTLLLLVCWVLPPEENSLDTLRAFSDGFSFYSSIFLRI
jgi:hypothetical protein